MDLAVNNYTVQTYGHFNMHKKFYSVYNINAKLSIFLKWNRT